MDTTKLEHKKRMIDSFVNAIYRYDDKIVFTFNYKDGSKTITMEEIENSALSSDLTSLGAPKLKKPTFCRKHNVGFFFLSEAPGLPVSKGVFCIQGGKQSTIKPDTRRLQSVRLPRGNCRSKA